MRLYDKVLIVIAVAVLGPSMIAGAGFEAGAVKQSDGTSFHMNTIPTIARMASGKLLAVWSAYAKGEDHGRIVAAFSTDGGLAWSEPRKLIETPGMDDSDPNIVVDGTRVFVYSTTTPRKMKLITGSEMFMTQTKDDGTSWTEPVQIPLPYKYFDSKVQNGIKLTDGTLAMGFSWDLWAQAGMPARTEGEMNLASGVLLSKDGVHWNPYGQLHVWTQKVTPFSTNGLCGAALVQLANSDLLMIMRTGTSFHYESRSHDGGLTWDPPRQSTVPGHNTPVSLWRLDQKPEEIIVVFNNSPHATLAVEHGYLGDGGVHWSKPRDIAAIEGLQTSYPNITQTQDGTFVVVWQQQVREGGRDIRWARFSRAWVLGEEK